MENEYKTINFINYLLHYMCIAMYILFIVYTVINIFVFNNILKSNLFAKIILFLKHVANNVDNNKHVYYYYDSDDE